MSMTLAANSVDKSGLSFVSAPDEVKRLSLSEAWKAVEGNRQMFRQAVKIILDDCPRLMEALENALATGNVSASRRAAHTLESTFRMFGMGAGATVAHRLQENVAYESSGCSEPLAELRQQCHQLQMLLAGALHERLRANSPIARAKHDTR